MQACSESAHAFITCAQLHSAFCRIDFSEELRLRSAIALAARFHPKPRVPPRGSHNSHGDQSRAPERMRLTRQRCQLALRTLSSLGVGDDAAKAASTSRRLLPRTSRRPSPSTPTATIAATRTMHPCWLALHLGWCRSTDRASRPRSDDKAFTSFVHERAELHDIVDHRWFLGCVGVSQPNPTGDSPVSTTMLPAR